MIERFFWIFWPIWGLWTLLTLLVVIRVWGYRFAIGREGKKWQHSPEEQRDVALVIAVKGFDAKHTPEFFQSLLEQDYRSYRLIITVESKSDPAALWLAEQFGFSGDESVWTNTSGSSAGLKSVTLVEAGESTDQGQKVHNQLAAFEALSSEDRIVAFADADIVCAADWLAKLVAPINSRKSRITTTYRWLVPRRPAMPNLFAAVINGSVATQGGGKVETLPWGGSMALGRKLFDELDIPGLLKGCLNDDLRIGKFAKAKGHKIALVRSIVRPTDIDFTLGGLVEFARRQYFQVKVYAPITFTFANLIFLIYLLGLGTAIFAIAGAYFKAWIPVAAVYALDQLRAMGRESVYRKLFADNEKVVRRLTGTSWVEHLLTPVWMLFHAMIIFSVWFKRKVTWAGITYRVTKPNLTEVVSRVRSSDAVDINSAVGLSLPEASSASLLEAEEVEAEEVEAEEVEAEEVDAEEVDAEEVDAEEVDAEAKLSDVEEKADVESEPDSSDVEETCEADTSDEEDSLPDGIEVVGDVEDDGVGIDASDYEGSTESVSAQVEVDESLDTSASSDADESLQATVGASTEGPVRWDFEIPTASAPPRISSSNRQPVYQGRVKHKKQNPGHRKGASAKKPKGLRNLPKSMRK
ncbi:MAG: glycosyltransferase family 2 protein [Verrucomicrobiota bacterium]